MDEASQDTALCKFEEEVNNAMTQNDVCWTVVFALLNGHTHTTNGISQSII